MNQTVLKSPNDKNLYKTLVLENGLKVLLIQAPNSSDANTNFSDQINEENYVETASENESDKDSDVGEVYDNNTLSEKFSENDKGSGDSPTVMKLTKKNKLSKESKMSAAALCINVGHFCDPVAIPGLAHFLEHMIFMGSEKYPEENHYDSFISEHGGSDNAYTSCEKTVFHMNVIPQNFKEALDIFANCFKKPLLKADSMDREVESVESEFQSFKASDSQRLDHILSSIAKTGHPVTKFQCGNKDTLSNIPATQNIDVNAELHKFRNQHYSAHRMTLAVQSTEQLETLEDWVTEIFSDIPNNGLPAPVHENFTEPFNTEAFFKIYKVVPVKTVDKLLITWALPPLQNHYRSKPLSYISFLVGHEAKGSILSYLKKRCWATSLVAGNDGNDYQMNGSVSLFSIIVELTKEGIDHIHEVATVIFQYVDMLRKNGPQEHIFKEIEIIANNSFRFQEPEDADDYVENIAYEMQLYPVEHYLCGNKLYFEYDPKIISECLELMKPNVANITILSSQYKESKSTHIEKWTECKYSVCDIPDEWMCNWKNLPDNLELHLPEPNIYLPTDFELKVYDFPENKHPVKIFEDDIGSVWFKEDRKFKVPRGYVQCFLSSPMMCATVENAVMLDLFNHIFTNILNEDVYPATMAELYYSSLQSTDGFLIEVGGFSHKLFLLLETVIDHIATFNPSDEQFRSLRHDLHQRYNNGIIKPKKLALNLRTSLLRNTSWPGTQKLRAILSITKPMLIEYVQKAFSTFHLQSYYHGNFIKEDVLAAHSNIKAKLKPSPQAEKLLSNIKITTLPNKPFVCRVAGFNKEDLNSVIYNYYQFGPCDLKSSCFVQLLMHFMYEPCFDVLRTREQLGYEVYCEKNVIWGIYGIDIFLQISSDKFSTSYVESRIGNFLINFIQDIKDIEEEKFENCKASLIQRKSCEDLNMADEVRRFWSELRYHHYFFNRKEKEIECLEHIQMKEFNAWLTKEFEDTVVKKRKLSIQVVGPYDDMVNKRLKTCSGDEEFIHKNSPLHFQDNENKHLMFLTEPLSNEEDVSFISDVCNFKSSLPFYTPNHIVP